MFYLVGLGLGNLKDITVRGLEIVRSCDLVFLEHYTSVLGGCSKEEMEAFYGREVVVADREMVESEVESRMLEPARSSRVALLVVGDPLGATTHTDLMQRCHELGVGVEVVHNCGIMNAVGVCGLQLYNFGQTVSMVFFTDDWRPDSFYDRVAANVRGGMHTLVLLDIKVKEQSIENILRNRKIYEPPRFMSVAQCAQQLLEVEDRRQQAAYSPSTLAVGLARVGCPDQLIRVAPLSELATADLGPPLHSLILVAETSLHPVEIDFLNRFR